MFLDFPVEMAQGMSKIYVITKKERGSKKAGKPEPPSPPKKNHKANMLGGPQIRWVPFPPLTQIYCLLKIYSERLILRKSRHFLRNELQEIE